MWNKCYVLFFFLCSLLFSSEVHASRMEADLQKLVVPIPKETWQRKLLQDSFSQDVQFLLRQNNKFILNQWYHEVKHFDVQKGRYLEFGGNTEHFIRPISHAAFTLAVCLKLDVYDEKVTGVSRKKAMEVVCRLVRSVAYRHKVNSGTAGWGDQWQSALWAAQVAEAA